MTYTKSTEPLQSPNSYADPSWGGSQGDLKDGQGIRIRIDPGLVFKGAGVLQNITFITSIQGITKLEIPPYREKIGCWDR